jgi:phage terminase Nu1 subunit (DNA packaging protein)
VIQIPYEGQLVEAWTAPEVLSIFKISKMTLHRWHNEGMPVARLGRAVFFPVTEVKNWVAQNKIDAHYGRKKYQQLWY